MNNIVANRQLDLIVIGASAGGLQAIITLLQDLPADFSFPIVIAQHRINDNGDLLEHVLQNKCQIEIRQANEKEKIKKGIVYIAPPDYHLLIERDDTFSLSLDEKVMYSRPSIDVLFESAAPVYKHRLMGILLTGANSDGANGMCAIKEHGGITISQDPEQALFSQMPSAAIVRGCAEQVLSLESIKEVLKHLSEISMAK